MAQDPVCKMTVDEKKAEAKSDYKGKTYYFCAKGCKEKFDKEPEKYVTKQLVFGKEESSRQTVVVSSKGKQNGILP